MTATGPHCLLCGGVVMNTHGTPHCLLCGRMAMIAGMPVAGEEEGGKEEQSFEDVRDWATTNAQKWSSALRVASLVPKTAALLRDVQRELRQAERSTYRATAYDLTAMPWFARFHELNARIDALLAELGEDRHGGR